MSVSPNDDDGKKGCCTPQEPLSRSRVGTTTDFKIVDYHGATGSNLSLNLDGRVVEPITPGSSTSLSSTPLPMNAQRKFSIGNNAVIPTLLNAQLNHVDLFDLEESQPLELKTNNKNQLDISKLCLEHKLSSISSALMTNSQLGKVIGGIRDLEQTLNRVNIRSKMNHILIVTKLQDPEPVKWASTVSKFLLGYNDEIKVYIEDKIENSAVYDIESVKSVSSSAASRIRIWQADKCFYRPEIFDLVLTFGGDGTVLYASWLFQSTIPPVLPFCLGSLGFLTNFSVADYEETLTRIIQKGYQCSIRMRFECTVMRSKHPDDPTYDLVEEVGQLGKTADATHDIEETYTVFNEVVVDRGPNSTMTSLEMFSDRAALTTAEADGLIISTPSGSTAYSLSAGGSLVHPEIPGILISPICPHTLSFRPLVIPDSIVLRLGVPYDARSTAWCSFDGRQRVELFKGDIITITASRYPLPCIKKHGIRDDWFERLGSQLHWNERKHQKPFNKSGLDLKEK